MTWFKKAFKLFLQLLNIRIWLAGLLVILVILLLALTVYNAREKETVDLFSRQQLASAQNAAQRMEDVFSQVEKNIALFTYFDPHCDALTKETYREMEVLYSVWGKTIDAVVLYDAEGKVKQILPQDVRPAVELIGHFHSVRFGQRQYLAIAQAEKLAKDTLPANQDRYLVWGYPLWKSNNIFTGAWMVSFKMQELLNTCQKQIQDNQLGDVWLVDGGGGILMHPHAVFVGKNINDLIILTTVIFK